MLERGVLSQLKTRPDQPTLDPASGSVSRGDTLSARLLTDFQIDPERSSLSYVLSIEPDLPAVPICYDPTSRLVTLHTAPHFSPITLSGRFDNDQCQDFTISTDPTRSVLIHPTQH